MPKKKVTKITVSDKNEPEVTIGSIIDILSLVKALNWYHINKSDADAAKYLGIKNTSIAKGNLTLAWMKRLKDRGVEFPEKENESYTKLDAAFNNKMKQANDAKNTNDDTNVVSIQERVQAKVDYFLMELEGKFDEYWHNRSKEDFIPYTWMVENEVKPMHATKIAEYCRGRAKEWVEIIEQRKVDEYVKESYPRSHKDYCHAANLWLLFATDAEKLAANKNAARAPRKKKPISQEKKVSKIKYQAEDVSLKITSISPIKILGSEQLWVYNTNTRKLGVYFAKDESGLSVKGSTIENYDESKSICKKLRKPEKILKDVLSVGKVGLRKVIGDINAKPSPLNGRINNQTILIRVL